MTSYPLMYNIDGDSERAISMTRRILRFHLEAEHFFALMWVKVAEQEATVYTTQYHRTHRCSRNLFFYNWWLNLSRTL